MTEPTTAAGPTDEQVATLMAEVCYSDLPWGEVGERSMTGTWIIREHGTGAMIGHFILEGDARRAVRAVNAEVTQQDGSALRLLYELSLMTRADDDTDPLFDELPVEWTDRALAVLAALPPGAPPFTDLAEPDA